MQVQRQREALYELCWGVSYGASADSWYLSDVGVPARLCGTDVCELYIPYTARQPGGDSPRQMCW